MEMDPGTAGQISVDANIPSGGNERVTFASLVAVWVMGDAWAIHSRVSGILGVSCATPGPPRTEREARHERITWGLGASSACDWGKIGVVTKSCRPITPYQEKPAVGASKVPI